MASRRTTPCSPSHFHSTPWRTRRQASGFWTHSAGVGPRSSRLGCVACRQEVGWLDGKTMEKNLRAFGGRFQQVLGDFVGRPASARPLAFFRIGVAVVLL